ncbi:MAG: hypothetical protein ACKO3Q_02920, partial [Betaproteobacteria bacterium]
GTKFLSTHREVMELRHQYVAHAGKNEQQQVFVALILEQASGHPKINVVMIQKATQILPSTEDLQQFKELCDKLVQSTNVRLKKATDDLIAHYQAMTFEQLHKATKP